MSNSTSTATETLDPNPSEENLDVESDFRDPIPFLAFLVILTGAAFLASSVIIGVVNFF